NLESLLVPDACKGIDPAPVGLLETSLENIGNTQFIGEGCHLFGNAEGHVLPFNGTRAGQKKKLTAVRMFYLGNLAQFHFLKFPQRYYLCRLDFLVLGTDNNNNREL